MREVAVENADFGFGIEEREVHHAPLQSSPPLRGGVARSATSSLRLTSQYRSLRSRAAAERRTTLKNSRSAAASHEVRPLLLLDFAESLAALASRRGAADHFEEQPLRGGVARSATSSLRLTSQYRSLRSRAAAERRTTLKNSRGAPDYP